MKKLTRWLVIGCLLALCVSLAGCGTGSFVKKRTEKENDAIESSTELQILPEILTPSSYHWILSQLSTPENLKKFEMRTSEEASEYIDRIYRHLDTADMIAEEESMYLAIYPNLTTTDLYERTFDLEPDVQEEWLLMLKTVGYTEKRRQADMKATGMTVENPTDLPYPIQSSPEIITEASYQRLLQALNRPDILERLDMESIEEVEYYLTDDFWGIYVYLNYDWMEDDERELLLERYSNLQTINIYVRAWDLSPKDEELTRTMFILAGYTEQDRLEDEKASGLIESE